MDNKTLIETASRRSGVSRKEATNMLAALAECVRDAAIQLDTVAIPSFGSFEPKKRAERVMSVPSSGRRLLLPPKITLGFKVATVLKQQLRDTPSTNQEL